MSQPTLTDSEQAARTLILLANHLAEHDDLPAPRGVYLSGSPLHLMLHTDAAIAAITAWATSIGATEVELHQHTKTGRTITVEVYGAMAGHPVRITDFDRTEALWPLLPGIEPYFHNQRTLTVDELRAHLPKATTAVPA